MNACKYVKISIFILVNIFCNVKNSSASNLEDLIFVKGTNEAGVESNQSLSAALSYASGHKHSFHEAPRDATSAYVLVSSIVGSPYPYSLGWVNPNPEGVPSNAAESLVAQGKAHLLSVKEIFSRYYRTDDPQTPESVYLNYDFFLYDESKDKIQYFEEGGQLTTDSEGNRQLVSAELFDAEKNDAAKEAIFTALQIDPYMTFEINGKEVLVANLLLDLSYYESASYIMKGNLALEKAHSVRFMEGLRNKNQVIFDELEQLGWNTLGEGGFSNSFGAWSYFIKSAEVWREVLRSPIQSRMLSENAASRDLGYLSFSITDSSEENNLVFDGYKDAVSVYKSIAKRSHILNEVAQRLVLILDREKAAEIVSEFATALSVEEAFWFEFFFSGALPTGHEQSYPGLTEAVYDLRANMTRLSTLRSLALNPELNGLGFGKNVLYVKAQGAEQTNFTATYDWFSSTLFREGGAPTGALNESVLADQKAMDARKNFFHKALNYINEYEALVKEYEDQLISITGTTRTGEPNFDSPDTGGGLLQQQLRNIEIARKEILRTNIRIANVFRSIEIEQERMAANGMVADKRVDIINEFGEKIGDLQSEIRKIQTDMKLANQLAESAAAATAAFGSDLSTLWGGPAIAAGIRNANAVFQKVLGDNINEKQDYIADLERTREVEFVYLSQEEASNNSAALIKDKWLEINVYRIDLAMDKTRLAQELDTASRYYDQIDRLKNQHLMSELRLLQKNFIDPTFRIEVTHAAARAQERFKSLQRWVFLMFKALEYKWPLTGEGVSTQMNIIKQEILMARTAKELSDILTSTIANFNDVQSFPQAFYYSSFSLKEDYLGINRIDADSGATELFVEYLEELLSYPENIIELSGGSRYLAIDFSTVKFDAKNHFEDQISVTVDGEDGLSQKPAKAAPLFSSELWDNKISWVQVNVSGNNVYTKNSQQMPIQLWYGGTGYLRTKDAFCVNSIDDTGEERSVKVDYREYSHPAYEFSLSEGALSWVANDYIKQQVNAKLVQSPRNIPDYTFQFNAFSERPVAASSWKILLPIDGLNIQNIRDIELSVVSKARTVNRPSEPNCE